MRCKLIAAAAQLGPIARNELRASAVARILALLEVAHRRGASLVVLTELALTTLFPRWCFEDEAALDAVYKTKMPGRETRPLFAAASRLNVGFYLGYGHVISIEI